MAIETQSYFSNASPGENQLWSGDLYADETSPKYPVGFRVGLADGRVFRYGYYGAAVNRGELVSQDLDESGVVDTDNKLISPASANDTTDGTIRSRFVQVTLASITDDQFAGGYLHTTGDVGEGFTYRIKGNNATNDPATNDFRLELYDPLQVAIDNTTDFAITGNMYANLEIATAATDIAVAGVAMASTAITNYGYVQTWGVSTILTDGTIVLGDQVSLSDSVNGAVQVGGGGGTSVSDLIAEQIVGYCIHVGDTGEHSSIFLQMSP